MDNDYDIELSEADQIASEHGYLSVAEMVQAGKNALEDLQSAN